LFQQKVIFANDIDSITGEIKYFFVAGTVDMDEVDDTSNSSSVFIEGSEITTIFELISNFYFIIQV